MKQPFLGIHVAELRHKKGMTQKDLADACQVDIRTIQRIESGEVTPRAFTIRLLSQALGANVADFNNDNLRKGSTTITIPRASLMAGIIFTVNYIPVVFQLMTKPFGLYLYGLTIAIHIFSCILFLRAFYLLGKQSGNQVMIISSLLSMILLPLLNIMNFFKQTFSWMSANTIFTIVCINAMIYGISLLIEANQRAGRINLYHIAGMITLIQSGLFLSSERKIVFAGLIISACCNIITVLILLKESKNFEKKEIAPAFI